MQDFDYSLNLLYAAMHLTFVGYFWKSEMIIPIDVCTSSIVFVKRHFKLSSKISNGVMVNVIQYKITCNKDVAELYFEK